MKEFVKKIRDWFRSHEGGFTLAELLVVVGIIVGLAAVILPNVGKFTGQGKVGALATELGSVQTAIDAFYADGGDIATNAYSAFSNQLLGGGGPIDLSGYLRLPNGATQTEDFYCWDTQGTVAQSAVTGACTLPVLP